MKEQRRLQRKLLDTVKTQGEIPIPDLAIELGVSRNQTREMLYQLVGLELFSGYVNWDEGVLYSQEASQLRDLERVSGPVGAGRKRGDSLPLLWYRVFPGLISANFTNCGYHRAPCTRSRHLISADPPEQGTVHSGQLR